MSSEVYITRRIEAIEEELKQLKKLVSSREGRIMSLRGVWEGLDIPNEAIEEAKRSLFKGNPVRRHRVSPWPWTIWARSRTNAKQQ